MSKVLLKKSGHIAVVTINRPEARNAFDPETVCLLADAFKSLGTDDDTRVVLITGAGDRAFSAGADLGSLVPLLNGARAPQDEWDRRVARDMEIMDRGMLRGYDIGKPLIAAINGFAIAGGMEIVQGADLRVAADTAKLGVQEVKWAIFPAGGSTVRLPAQMTMPRALELLLTGELINAQTALQWGFLNRVVAPAEVMDTALDLADRIARNGPLAVQAVRRSARACLGHPEAEALAMERAFAAPVFASEDAREGPRAFIEKRAPAYRGR